MTTNDKSDYMFRIIVMILGIISFLIAVMDIYSFAGFKITNNILKVIIYLICVICGLLFFTIDIYDWIKMKK